MTRDEGRVRQAEHVRRQEEHVRRQEEHVRRQEEHVRQDERARRAEQGPIVPGLPDVPGIGVAMRLTPGLGVHLRGLADEVLVNDFPGATLARHERELLATAVSAANDCFFCMDSHGAFATALLERDGLAERVELIDVVKQGASDGFDPKMRALLHIARVVRGNPLDLTADDVHAAKAAGAADADVQLAVLIASAFSMYNRLVDGFRAVTPPSVDAYRQRAAEIAELGYSAPSPSASSGGANGAPAGNGQPSAAPPPEPAGPR
ncbi:MAG TPA: carboxymuconolactone decarboxylase family protein [Candidatus Binatia bacterium]|nr:carboxymuconolactone decarboxylase family protein [Candidatus Binatia bacterium]